MMDFKYNISFVIYRQQIPTKEKRLFFFLFLENIHIIDVKDELSFIINRLQIPTKEQRQFFWGRLLSTSGLRKTAPNSGLRVKCCPFFEEQMECQMLSMRFFSY